jgi:hypothetical protein
MTYRIRLVLIALVLAVLAAPCVYAFTLTAPQGTIDIQTGATQSVDIIAYSDIREQLTIGIGGEKPWSSLSAPQPVLEAGIQSNITLYFSPYSDTILGLYKFQVIAESIDTGERRSVDIYVNVKKGEGVIIEKMTISGETVPLGSATVKIYTKNIGVTTAINSLLNIVVYSPEGIYTEINEIINSINPGESRLIEKQITFPAGTAAGDYHIDAKLVYKNSSSQMRQDFEIIQKAVIKRTEKKEDIFAGYRKTIMVKNLGNKISETIFITEQLSVIDGIFFSGYIPNSAAVGVYVWHITDLKPGEEKIIYYEISYANLYILLAALLIASFVGLFYFRTIRVSKYIIQKKNIEEGEEFTVGIDIKNATGRKVNDVIVRDFIPSIFKVEDTEGVKPLKKKVAGGIELRWKLNDLYNREERVLTYKIIPVFGVHGKIPIPAATIETKFLGRTLEKRSNTPQIGVELQEKETGIDDMFSKEKKAGKKEKAKEKAEITDKDEED